MPPIVVTFDKGVVTAGLSRVKAVFSIYNSDNALHITAVTADRLGRNSEIASVGCKLLRGIHTIPEMKLEIPSVDAHRQHIAIIFRVLTAVKGSESGYQIVSESIVPLGLYIPDDLQAWGSNRCVYDTHPVPDEASGVVESPLCVLLRTGTLNIKKVRLLGDAGLSKSALFSWEDPDYVAGYLTTSMQCEIMTDLHALLVSSRNFAPTIELIVADNASIVGDMWTGRARYTSLFYNDRGQMQEGMQYQNFAIYGRGVLRHLHLQYHLDPQHCRTDTRVLLGVLYHGCRLSGVTLEEFGEECKTHPLRAILCTYKTCLVAIATSIQYQIDFDCTENPGERFTNIWALLQSMADIGLGSENVSADCEDFAMCIAKLHVAFSCDPCIISGYNGASALEKSVLLALHKATSNYTAHPLVCSIYTDGGLGTHTCTVLIHKDAINSMMYGAEGDSNLDIHAVVVLEGTALVSQDGDTLDRHDSDHRVDDTIARELGLDIVYPTNMKSSGFYAFANQICVDGKDYMMMEKQTDDTKKLKIGVPFIDFVTSATRICTLQPMYKYDVIGDNIDAIWRYLCFRCPAYPLAFATSPSNGHGCVNPPNNGYIRPRWGIPRGPKCRLYTAHTNEITSGHFVIGSSLIARGWTAFYYLIK